MPPEPAAGRRVFRPAPVRAVPRRSARGCIASPRPGGRQQPPRSRLSRTLVLPVSAPRRQRQRTDHRSPLQSHHHLSSSGLARLTATRSCAPQVRTVGRSAFVIRRTRICTFLPSFVVYGGPTTSYSPVSSMMRSRTLIWIGSTTSTAACPSRELDSADHLAIPSTAVLTLGCRL